MGALEDANNEIRRIIQGQAAQGKWSKAQTDNMMGYAGVGGSEKSEGQSAVEVAGGVATGGTYDGTKFDVPGSEPLPAEGAGKAAMIEQALSDLDEVEPLLFPGEGKEEKFARGLAAMSNLPGSDAPLLGAMIPSSIPGHTNARKVDSLMSNALEAKLRIETGAAATKEEYSRLKERFGITAFDTAESAKNKWRRLKEFMESSTAKLDPQGGYTYYDKKGLDVDNPKDALVTMSSPEGEINTVSQSEVAEAVQNGWKVQK